MRYVAKQHIDGLWYVRDEWRNEILVENASREYCEGFLAGIAAVGGH